MLIYSQLHSLTANAYAFTADTELDALSPVLDSASMPDETAGAQVHEPLECGMALPEIQATEAAATPEDAVLEDTPAEKVPQSPKRSEQYQVDRIDYEGRANHIFDAVDVSKDTNLQRSEVHSLSAPQSSLSAIMPSSLPSCQVYSLLWSYSQALLP